MNMESLSTATNIPRMVVLLALWPMIGFAQVPVDESGNALGEYQAEGEWSVEAEADMVSPADLQDLVGGIALYPDDLLAIILPASTYPLQLVEASRFLEQLEQDPSLQPDEDWDDSVVALINYPEVIELLNADLDWTWQLGEAVVAQQADVIAAIETFRDRAYAAGNLKSDEYQEVSNDEGVIEITPVNEEIIYVPYYEPEQVVVYQPQPVYYYHPRPYPVYYYPYAYDHSFRRGFFWGVTTAFTIGWATDYLHVYHHSYYGHPYYGRSYNRNWWYRRPSITVYNNYYSNNDRRRTVNHYQNGDQWRSNNRRRLGPEGRQITRTRYQSGANTRGTRVSTSTSNSFAASSSRNDRRDGRAGTATNRTTRTAAPGSEKRRGIGPDVANTRAARQQTTRASNRTDSSSSRSGRADSAGKIKFRSRESDTPVANDRRARTATPSRQANINRTRSDSLKVRKSPEPRNQVTSRSNTRFASTQQARSTPRATSSRESTTARRKTNSNRERIPARSVNTARTQTARVGKSQAPRQQAQRQNTSKSEKSPSRGSKSNDRSGSNKSASAPRSNNRKSGNEKVQRRRT